MDNASLIQIFCQPVDSAGRCQKHGNLSFDLDAQGHGVLRSYRAVIAIRGPYGLVVSTKRWSSTTSHHQALVRRCAREANLTILDSPPWPWPHA